MIDRKFIGLEFPSRTISVEAGQLKAFAKATGETNPVYFEEGAARAAGYPGLLAPPTFAFTLERLMPPKLNWMRELGIHVSHILHGEQEFEYFQPFFAGDVITLSGRIADIYEKKSGTLQFIVLLSDAANQKGELCVTQRTVTVVREMRASA